MSLFGTPIVQSIAGAVPAERAALRESDRKRVEKGKTPARGDDEVQISSSQAEDAVRNLKGNADEETADDRAEQDHYRPPVPQKDAGQEGPEDRPRLDVQA